MKLTIISIQGVCLRGINLSLRTIDCIKRYVLDSAVYLINGKNVILNYMLTNIKRHP